MSRSLGIDFGYSTATASLGYIRFETQTSEGKATVSVESPSRISTLANFKTEVLKDACGNGVSVIALDAPITPKLISSKPVASLEVRSAIAVQRSQLSPDRFEAFDFAVRPEQSA